MKLSKYGINIDFTPDTKLDTIQRYEIQSATRFTSFILINEQTSYRLYNTVGLGSFGKTYRAMANGKMFAVKILKHPNIQSLLSETIIHILLMKESEEEENGPFVPRLYEIAYNPDMDEAYIVSELMIGTLFQRIQLNSKEENDHLIVDVLNQITDALAFFGDRLQFNHRDLKPDNIMYSKTPYGAYSFKLIDFGLSCLTWKGLTIHDAAVFTSTNPCFKQDRDIPQLLYSLIIHVGRKFLSDTLLPRLDAILVSTINNDSSCYMIDGCTKEGLKDWGDTYRFLNRENISVPSGRINRIKRHMNNFSKGKPFMGNTTRNTPKRLFRNNTRKLNRNLIGENEN